MNILFYICNQISFTMKKITFLLLLVLFSVQVNAQESKTVTLTVSAQGQTKDEAKQNALRDAIEQAFGTFISSKTEVLNNNLVKDEIVSVSNGSIQEFDILSEFQMQNGEWSITLKTVVSVTKLTSFCESKGISVEFKGSLFAFNVNQQKLNEKNEIIAIENLSKVIKNLADRSFDYTVTVLSEPTSYDEDIREKFMNRKHQDISHLLGVYWKIPMYISVYKNKNIDNLAKIFYSTIKGLSLTEKEAENYIKLGKRIYPLSIAASEEDMGNFCLRNEQSVKKIVELLHYFNHSLQNFKVSNGVDEFALKDYKSKPFSIDYIYDNGFRIFLEAVWMRRHSEYRIFEGSVFYKGDRYDERCNIGLIKNMKAWEENRAKTFAWECQYFRPGDNVFIDYENVEYINVFFDDILRNMSVNPFAGYGVFSFTSQLSRENKMPFTNNGLVISFLPDDYSNRKKKKKKKKQQDDQIKQRKEIVRYYIEDVRSTDEINKISEYKIIPNTFNNID